MPTHDLSPELAQIRLEAEKAAGEIATLSTGLSDEQLTWRERPNKWCIAEILEHLSLTVELCAPSLDRAIENARRNGWLSNGPFRLGPMGRFFVWYVEPPPVIKLPAPKSLVPGLKGRPQDALPEFIRSQEKVFERLEAANGLDLTRARFVSPFASFVRMDLLALFSVYTAHERRHLWQLKRLRESMEAQCS